MLASSCLQEGNFCTPEQQRSKEFRSNANLLRSVSSHHEGAVGGALVQLARLAGGLVFFIRRQERPQVRFGFCLRPVLLLLKNVISFMTTIDGVIGAVRKLSRPLWLCLRPPPS